MTDSSQRPLRVDPYVLLEPIASGGMATVYLAKLVRPGGFQKVVAIKRLHQHLAAEGDFVSNLLDEARFISFIASPNVVGVVDVVRTSSELLLVMDYVHGLSVAAVSKSAAAQGLRCPPAVACAIMLGTLNGLHAAHEAKDETGRHLQMVHRDVSPQNVLVGIDGLPRVVDFGIAKAVGRLQETTKGGAIKGKLGYLAPEQVASRHFDRRVDIYAAGVMFWELLTGRRLFTGADEVETLSLLLARQVPLPSSLCSVTSGVDDVVMKALAVRKEDRYATCAEMIEALARALPPAAPYEVSAWLKSVGGERLARVDAMLGRNVSSRLDSVSTKKEDAASSCQIPVHVETQATLLSPTDDFAPPAAELSDRRTEEFSFSGAALSVNDVPFRRRLIGGTVAALLLSIAGVFAVRSPSPHPVAATAEPIVRDTPSEVFEPLPYVAPPQELPAAPAASSHVLPPKPAPPAAASKLRGAKTGPPCKVPYEIDARGIKHYRMECM